MTEKHTTQTRRQPSPAWLAGMNRFMKPDIRKAILQIINSLVPYVLLWVLMVLMLQKDVPYGYVLLVSLLAALWLVRIFIIFHDCTHNSFFTSNKANLVTGTIFGILTFTPYREWQSSHMRHHQTAGDLDNRGVGDVMTWTVKEYLEAPRGKRIFYRIYRNPLVLLIIGPIYSFLIRNRWSHKGAGRKEIRSVIITDIGILAIILATGFTLGFHTYLLIQLPVIFLAGVFGIWLFYVQHQFREVYWVRHDQWNPLDAAMKGSSFYKLPKVFQWFSGNIGFHHIHHLRPAIPNYHLESCYREVPETQQVKPLTPGSSLHCLFMNLYDEEAKQMVSFRSLKSL